MTAAARGATGAGGQTFRSFAFRNFRLFFAGQMISQVGNWLTMIALALFVLHLTDNGLAVGVMTACQFLPVLVLGPWAGLVADRSDKRRLLIVVQAFAMVQSLVLAALAFSGDPPLWTLYLTALAGGVAVAFDSPARRAFVVEMVPEDHVNNAVSLNSALMTGARVVGPALAGGLIYFFGYGWAFLVDGISYLAVIAGLYLISAAELRSAPAASRGRGQVREGLRYVAQVRDLWVPLVMMVVIGTFTFNFQVVLPLFVTRSLGSTSTMYTILWSVVSVGAVAGALTAARRAERTVHDVVVAAAAFGLAMLLLAAAPTLWLAFPAGVVMGFTSILFMTACTAIVQMRAAPQMRGRVLALQSMVFLGSTPIGGPVLGYVCDVLGARAGVVVGAAAALFAAGLGWQINRSSRPDPGHAPEAAAVDAEAEPTMAV